MSAIDRRRNLPNQADLCAEAQATQDPRAHLRSLKGLDVEVGTHDVVELAFDRDRSGEVLAARPVHAPQIAVYGLAVHRHEATIRVVATNSCLCITKCDAVPSAS